MLYLLAAIGTICVVVLLWRAFVANPTTAADRRTIRPSSSGGRPGRPPRRPARPVAPDDDPEFLRSLGQQKEPPPENNDGTPPPA